MKKTIIIGFMVMATFNAWAGTEFRDACRKVLYAVKPVEVIAGLENNTLTTLHRYALGIPAKDQEPLNDTDAYLFAWLSNTEFARRDKTPDEFSLYLQERREQNAPALQKLNSTAIKIDGWIDLFQLNLMFSSY
jgi:hypothetical protein